MAKHGRQLPKDVQRYIVVHLACFETPTEVATAVKEEFGIELLRQNVAHYDPTYAGADAAKEWRQLFTVTRKAYLEETATVPVANQGFRLREIQKLFLRAKQRNADRLAAEFLKQAAEEVGGVYTTRRQFEVSDPSTALAHLLGVNAEQLPIKSEPN